jgi:antirestriction protein ArdC
VETERASRLNPWQERRLAERRMLPMFQRTTSRPQSSRDEKVQELIDRMADGVAQAIADPSRWQAALRRQARFHTYSWGNQLLIAVQRPQATQVAGYRTWQRLGRQVRKGEKGIAILAPMTVRKTVEDEETGETRTVYQCVGFRVEYVFDIAQTDPIPGKAERTPEPLTLPILDAWAKLVEYAEGRGLRVTIGPTGDARGWYNSATREIRVSATLEGAWRVRTLAHEIAHSILHPLGYDAGEEPRPRDQAELEAESTAFVVLSALGINTDEVQWYSFGYVAGWRPKPEEVVAAGNRIAKAAKMMIEAVLGKEEREEVA